MALKKIINLLDARSQNLLLSLILIFPVSYADCYLISAEFRNLELIKSCLLAAALATLLLPFSCLTAWAWAAIPRYLRNRRIPIFINVFPAVVISAMLWQFGLLDWFNLIIASLVVSAFSVLAMITFASHQDYDQ